MMIAIILTIIALSVPGTTAGLSTNMANFLTVFNGNYDNLVQYENNQTEHNYIRCRAVPVTAPMFSQGPVLFVEWGFNGVVLTLQLAVLSEDNDGVIHLPLYNFTDPSLYKPGEYNVEDLSKLTPQDLQPSTCDGAFKPDGPGEFLGTWPDCRHYVNGKPDLYTDTSTCDALAVVIPRSASETSSVVPYNLVRKGDKYPVADLPDGFVSPCK